MTAPPRTVTVAGDVTIDWNIARTRGTRRDAGAWTADEATRASWQRGGAALVADLIAALARDLAAAGGPAWHTRPPLAPAAIVSHDDRRHHHSYAIWSNQSAAGKPAWRIEEFLGFDRAQPVVRDPAYVRTDDESPHADLVVIDDAALGFRDQADLWPAAIAAPDARPWIVLKIARPVAQGPLWEHLHDRHADRLIVVMTAADLRRTAVQISQELSWERTAQDLAWELVHNPAVNGLSRCAHTIVSFDTAGAFLLSGGRSSLFFDPQCIEGGWAAQYRGGVIGYTTCLTAGIVRQLLIEPAEPDLAAGIQAGLAAMRELHLHGYGDESTDPAPRLAFPLDHIARQLAGDHHGFTVTPVQDPVRFLSQPAAGHAREPRVWTILDEAHGGDPAATAERILLDGPDQAIVGVPLGRFGKLLTIDRREIEAFRAVRALMLEYLRGSRVKPLSIAVFGAPGSGKSFGVTEVATSLAPGRIEPRQFNLSQFTGPADLQSAFHQIRDVGLSGRTPLVFWDEFDTSLDGQRLGWLRHFLAPMQDGAFQQGEVTHPIGRSIFVFAGGTRATMDAFLALAHEAPSEFRSAKGPDFVSRLKGFVNILGPDRQGATATAQLLDTSYVIRRAILLRSILKRDAPHVFAGERLRIDAGVLHAFLHTRRYTHGVRSMESIVAMSTLTDRTAYERSCLPPADQLDLHVDALDFQVLVQQPELAGDLLERLARAAHEIYCAGKRRDGYSWGERRDEVLKTTPLLVDYEALPEAYKEANRVTVRNIPKKLAAAGYVMLPSRSNDPPFAFPGDDLERLAELEHQLWMDAKLADGWTAGQPADGDLKRSPYIVPWEQVPDAVRQADRDLVLGIPRILAAAGYAVVKVREAGAKVADVEGV